jgi:hypothetical protein
MNACFECADDLKEICAERYGTLGMPPCASKPVELSPTAPNSASAEIAFLESLLLSLSTGSKNDPLLLIGNRLTQLRTLP